MSQSDKDNSVLAAGAGALTGGASAVGAVAALGVPGLGAAGITSGLATVGTIVGGGMSAGLILTAAAPVAVGAVAYSLYKWLKD
jgi:peptidoglycan/LPS O-acetylase OafA/YrhL